MKKSIVLFLLCIGLSIQSFGQCAMCKTTIVNNVSNGELSLAEGLNFGILYLFITPYLAILLLGFLWYKKSGYNGKRRNVQ